MLGTFIEVTSSDPRAAAIVFKEIERIEGLLSKYDPQSEVSKLNKTGLVKASPETFYIIKRAKEFCRLTDGAFDITVAPLMDLWGFTDKKFCVPEESKIKDALALVGSEKIILQESDNVIKFKLSGMKIDLGGIAKGYAVDCAVGKLKEAGINSCLINAGGQIYALGDKFGQSWQIAIRRPDKKAIGEILSLKNKAVSTSGDYEQYFAKNKRVYGHILDPRIGYPAETDIASVTVIADDGLTADALATAIFVLGENKSRFLRNNMTSAEFKIVKRAKK